MINLWKRVLMLVVIGAAVSACATKEERLSPDEVKNLSGQQSDFSPERGYDPAGMVGGNRDLSQEQINVRTFIESSKPVPNGIGYTIFDRMPEERKK